MAKRDWAERVVSKLLEVVEEDFDMDSDDLIQAIKDNVDVGDVIGDMFREDPEFQSAVKKKIQSLFLQELENCDNLEELMGSDDYLTTYLPDDFVTTTLTDLFVNNEEAKKELQEKMKSLVESGINNFDSDNLPEWDELVKLLNIEEVLKKVIQEDEIRIKTEEAFRDIVKEWIDENLDTNALPGDFTDKLLAIAPIDRLLSDMDFRRQIVDLLVNAVKQLAVNQLQDSDSELNQKLLASGALSAIARQMEDLVRDPEVQRRVKETLKDQLRSDGRLTGVLVQGLMSELSKTLVSRLFDKRI